MSAIEVSSTFVGHIKVLSYPNGTEKKMWMFGKPSDDGEIGCKHDIYNASGRVIKCVKITYEGYDSLENVVTCNVTGEAQIETEFTGPIQPAEKFELKWGCLWYNDDVISVDIKKIVVDFADGTTETFVDDEILSMYDENSEYQKAKKAEEDKKRNESFIGKLKSLFKK